MATRRTKTARRAVPRRRVSQRKVARPWTREEIAFMRKYYRKFETSWIARQLGRTVYSVRYKASSMNIKKANPNVWKGNKGSKNAFNSFAPKRSKTSRRTTPKRRTPSKRQYRATNKRRQTRKASPRRTTRKASPRRRTRR